jgi:hypothetical protein
MISSKTLTREQILREYNGVFTGLRCLSGEYHLEIDKSVKPVQHQPRRVAALMKQAIKQKISDLEKMGIITKVTEPTEWISSMVVVKKPSKFRICLDPKDLNKALQPNPRNRTDCTSVGLGISWMALSFLGAGWSPSFVSRFPM